MRTTRPAFSDNTVRTLTSAALLIAIAATEAFAQSPWERAALNLETSFTGPLARSLALVSIVIGGLMFMFGEGGPDPIRWTGWLSRSTLNVRA